MFYALFERGRVPGHAVALSSQSITRHARAFGGAAVTKFCITCQRSDHRWSRFHLFTLQLFIIYERTRFVWEYMGKK